MRLRSSWSTVVLVSALGFSSCASARSSSYGEPSSYATNPSYANSGDAREAPSMVTEAMPQQAPVRGLFDFSSDKVSGPAPSPAGGMPAPATAMPPPPPPPKPVTVAAADKPDRTETASKRLIVYKGTLTVLVPSLDVASDKLTADVKAMGGYVENQSTNTNANTAVLTMRVPAEKFFDLVTSLGGYGQVTQKDISADDVTKKVFDLELRLETAEKARQRLVDLLKTATKTEDVLTIEREIRRLTDEIEGLKGEIRFFKDQAAFSTLTVSFYSNAPPPTAGPVRARSRFEWINKVGIENVLTFF